MIYKNDFLSSGGTVSPQAPRGAAPVISRMKLILTYTIINTVVIGFHPSDHGLRSYVEFRICTISNDRHYLRSKINTAKEATAKKTNNNNEIFRR